MGTKTENVGDEYVSVLIGSRVPGLCFQIGRRNAGVSFGYSAWEKVMIVKREALSSGSPVETSFGLPLGANDHGKWYLGYQFVNHLPAETDGFAVVTGKALAGLGAQAERGGTGITVGMSSRQRLACGARDARFDIDQDAGLWPGFDFFNAKITSVAGLQTNQNHPQEKQ